MEPIIGRLKADHKMQNIWLKGHIGDIMAPILPASGFNLKKLLTCFGSFCARGLRAVSANAGRFICESEKFEPTPPANQPDADGISGKQDYSGPTTDLHVIQI